MLEPGKSESTLKKLIGQKKTLVAALIDPEDFTKQSAAKVAKAAQKLGVSLILVGGSTIADQTHLDDIVTVIKHSITLPVILFPGNITGLSRHADAILFSCLLNSTNPYFIMGAQSIGALQVNRYNLEAIPMGYLVFGADTAVGFIGDVKPIPLTKPSIAVMYALAAQYFGMRTLYLEAGSGASVTIPPEIVKIVRKYYNGILIVGGGITEPKSAKQIADAGADIIVIGNMLESSNFETKLAPIIKAVNNGRSL